MGLVCPGVVRIVDNAGLGMNERFPGWPGWYDDLTAILKLLSSDSFRQRCVYQRVRGSARPDLEPNFRHTLPSLA
eukprot:11219996-Lingulodinium_polyedra.AAC.1